MVAWELEPKLWPSARYQFCSLLTWRALALLIARRAMQTANMSQRERLGRRERLDRWWWFKHWFKQKKEDGSGSERLGRLALTEHYNHLRWHFHCIVVSWLLLFVSIFFFLFFWSGEGLLLLLFWRCVDGGSDRMTEGTARGCFHILSSILEHACDACASRWG